MQLWVVPEQLDAAGAALFDLAARLSDTADAVEHRVLTDAPALNSAAAEPALDAGRAGVHAVRTLSDDLDELGRALRVLAGLYARIDAAAIAN